PRSASQNLRVAANGLLSHSQHSIAATDSLSIHKNSKGGHSQPDEHQATMDQVAKLALEDGTVFTGQAFGAAGETSGEVVFNTSMTGYQEVLTDPSYQGQIVTMTYPLIGNYGITAEDEESAEPHVAGFIVRERARVPSNFRSESDLDSY